MHIGIDARFYSPSATGIGRHVSEVINHLGKLDTNNQYTIFLNKKNAETFIPPAPNFKTEITNTPHYSLIEQTKFCQQLNRHNFDLMIFPQFNVPFLYRKPFLVTIHDLTIHFFPGKKSNPIKHFLYKKVIQNAAQKSKKILAVSENTKSDIVKHLNVPASKISVVGNGISSTFKKGAEEAVLKLFREKYKLPQKYFLYTGVMRTHKNILGLINAFHLFHQKNKTIHLVLAGPKDDLYFPEILEKVKSLNLEAFVHFTGFFPEEDFSNLFAAATAFVFPSFYEGFGIPPLEAMSIDLPVICANTSSLPEVCGDAALYFDPNSIEAIAEKMHEVLKTETRDKLIQVGQKQWKKFTWESVGKKYFEIINSQQNRTS